MYEFSKSSKEKLATCHPKLQLIANEVAKEANCTVLCGYRTKEEQDEVFRSGKSKVKWPKGRHNTLPSRAMDLVPFPVKWLDEKSFIAFSNIVKTVAARLGIKIVWGGDWFMQDMPHYELDSSEV